MAGDLNPGSGSRSEPSVSDRYKWGLIAVAIGVGAIIAAFLIVALLWRGPDGTSALGIVASPIAAIVGAYFGIQVSAASAQTAQEQAKQANADKNDAVEQKSQAAADARLAFSVLQKNDEESAQAIRDQLRTIK